MDDPVASAVRVLSRGGLVAYPTDTLYGLAVRADRPDAIRRLWAAKDRPRGLPISVAVSSTEEIEPLAHCSDGARAFLRAEMPGAVTALLRARPTPVLSRELLAADGTVGIRVPDHPLARELARRAGPITATSANRHGQLPATSIDELRKSFGRSVGWYLSEGPEPSGHPSRLMDLTGSEPRRVERRPSGGRG